MAGETWIESAERIVPDAPRRIRDRVEQAPHAMRPTRGVAGTRSRAPPGGPGQANSGYWVSRANFIE